MGLDNHMSTKTLTITQRAILELVLSFAGFSLFWYATNWQAAFGLFLSLLANNIGHSRRV
jgi:hypothetical protein